MAETEADDLHEGLTRDMQEIGVLYICPSGEAFHTTDGLGRYWFDTDEEGFAELGEDFPYEILDLEPEDY